MENLPNFFAYKDKNDKEPDLGYENLQDFFLRWTIRCAEEKYKNINQKLNKNSKRILFYLLYGNPNLEYQVKDVKSWRQENNIDLLFEISVIEENGKESNYVLNIENKWYTNISDNQLQKYNDYLNSKYLNSNFNRLNYVIYCDSEKIAENEQKAKESNYEIISVEDLMNVINNEEKTGNDLFDEYWFNS